MTFGTIITDTILAVLTFTNSLNHIMEAPTHIIRFLHFLPMQNSLGPPNPPHN